jgi:hypothetical protein
MSSVPERSLDAVIQAVQPHMVMNRSLRYRTVLEINHTWRLAMSPPLPFSAKGDDRWKAREPEGAQ